MVLELKNRQISFVVGESIEGVVHVNQQFYFNAKDLTISLSGMEHTFMRKSHQRTYSTGGQALSETYNSEHWGAEPICFLTWVVKEFPARNSPPGMYSFPFKIQIPNWLPGSMVIGIEHEQTNLQIRYCLKAQFTPTDPKDLADNVQTSIFRTQQNIFLFRPRTLIAPLNLKADLVAEVGGLMGWGQTKSTSEIVFEKNEYYIGEQANVRIICNNTSCKKDVRAFKFKLFRVIVARERLNGGAQTKKGIMISAVKMPGCKAGEKIDRVFQVQIPSFDLKPQLTKYVPVSAEEMFLFNNFTCSVNSKLFQIQYFLKCFVKHDAWNEFGEGKFVSQPIKIIQQPPSICITSPSAQYQVPQDWEPVVMGEVVFQEDSENAIDLKASTYKSEQKQKEDDWSRFSIPVVMAADYIKQFEVDEKFEYAYDEHYDQQAAQESWDLPVFKEIESDNHPLIINTSS